MSRIRADKFVNNAGTGAPELTYGATVPSNSTISGAGGINITGVATASSFVGDGSNLTGISSVSFATTAFALEGTPDITANNIVAAAATFSGNVSIAGTLTYEDVTNIDSIGIITARTGVRVTAGGLVVTAGISTLTDGIDASDLLKEEVNITAGKLSDNTNIDIENGMVHYFTTTETTTSTPNIRYSSSESLTSKMSVGQSIVVTLITAAAAGAFSANITIDGGAVTEYWIGGSAPDAGGTSGVDVHTFTIIKIGTSGTPNGDFRVIANHSKTST